MIVGWDLPGKAWDQGPVNYLDILSLLPRQGSCGLGRLNAFFKVVWLCRIRVRVWLNMMFSSVQVDISVLLSSFSDCLAMVS